MCKAMNRSLVNVLFSGFGGGSAGNGGADKEVPGLDPETTSIMNKANKNSIQCRGFKSTKQKELKLAVYANYNW